jgi:hypothetical protein
MMGKRYASVFPVPVGDIAAKSRLWLNYNQSMSIMAAAWKDMPPLILEYHTIGSRLVAHIYSGRDFHIIVVIFDIVVSIPRKKLYGGEPWSLSF